MSQEAKITVLDIETSANKTFVWGLWDQNIQPSMILEDWRIMCFAAKRIGSSEVYYKEARTKEDELNLLGYLWAVLDGSDIVVAHNGKKFDLKKINARMIANNIPPYKPVHVIDTLQEIRNIAAFSSNKLEYLTDRLCTQKKLNHSKFQGFSLWRECLAGNPEAWAEMQEYNKQDVVSLEELYLKIRPWIKSHPNLGVYTTSDSPVCTKCGSTDLVKWGTAKTQVGTYQTYKCKGCGGYSRGRSMLLPKAEREHILRSQ